MTRIVLVAALVFFMVGCSRKIVPSSDTQRRDSTVVSEKTTVKDTTVFIAGDSAQLTVDSGQLTVEQPVTFVNKSKQATVTLISESGKVTAKCYCDSIEAKLKETVTERNYYRQVSETAKKTTVVTERYVPWFIKILAWVGACALAALVLFLIFKFKL